MNNTHENPSYREGRKSYFDNNGRYKNPYPPGSMEYDSFERGWSQALKKNPEIAIRENKQEKTQKAQESAKELKLHEAKEAYLKYKGY